MYNKKSIKKIELFSSCIYEVWDDIENKLIFESKDYQACQDFINNVIPTELNKFNNCNNNQNIIGLQNNFDILKIFKNELKQLIGSPNSFKDGYILSFIQYLYATNQKIEINYTYAPILNYQFLVCNANFRTNIRNCSNNTLNKLLYFSQEDHIQFIKL